MVMIAYMSFTRPSNVSGGGVVVLSPLSIEGVVNEVTLECSLKHPYEKEPVESFVRSPSVITGLTQTEVYLQENIPVAHSRFVRLQSSSSSSTTTTRLEFSEVFLPGCVLVIRVSPPPSVSKSLSLVKKVLEELEEKKNEEWKELVEQLTLVDVERIVYRSSSEEQSDGKGIDVYSLPGWGPLVYCGLQGLINVFDEIRVDPSLAIRHPLIVNLKQGNWLLDYISHRLVLHSSTELVGLWFRRVLGEVGELTRLLVPMYLERLVRLTFSSLLTRSEVLLGPLIFQSSRSIRQLGQTSVQLLSVVRSARLPLLSPQLREPRPTEGIDEQTLERVQQCPSLAAGLPHFSSGIWRNWGRDTFISLRGLLLLTGRFEEARFLLLSYGGCLRHGLIPNLLADGKIARYNARDAVWWWIYSISQYTRVVPDGWELLSDRVSRLYPTNDSPAQSAGVHDQSLFDVIQEVFLRHLQSLNYRERGAGHSLDQDMSDEGFNNQIGIDLKTGFVFGGNRWNCGTWMDKMGSSERANNKSHPATPRDGSAVELVGLLRASLAFVIQANQQGFYPYDSVDISSSQFFSLLVPSRLSLFVQVHRER